MRSTIVRFSLFGLGLALLIGASAATAFAGAPTAPAPEIDGGTIATGLAGLSAAVLILRARRGSK